MDEPTTEFDPGADLTLIVEAAIAGDQAAWDEIVDRFTPLLVRVLLSYRLHQADLEDVAQTVWLRLVERLADVREARALPAWIITTARREALHLVTRATRTQPHDPLDPSWMAPMVADPDPVDGLERAERESAVLEGFASLSARHRRLLELLAEDPPLSYSEVSRRSGMPVGSIGPTRARALEVIRRAPAVQALMAFDVDMTGDRR